MNGGTTEPLAVPPPRGFMHAMLAPTSGAPDAAMTSATVDDERGLATLLFEAYRGTVDDEGEDEDAALHEVRKTMRGDYGTWRPDASCVHRANGRLTHATLVTQFHARPFVAFSRTHPDGRRRGLATRGLTEAMRRLAEAGGTELWLVVTFANVDAVRVYERLGFRHVPRPASSID